MPRIERHAKVTWEGNVARGEGLISAGTVAFTDLPYSLPARISSGNEGKTSPEELIAAAHAACFSMALSHGLAQQGNAPEQLKTAATVTFVPGTGITKIALTVRARVPGLDEAAFAEAARTAKENCPVSQALAGVNEITLDASLES